MLKIDISGETMIFKNDKGFYTTSISRKLQDGSYENKYINVNFKKGVDIPNKTLINVKNSWLTFNSYETKDGKKGSVWVIFVNDYTMANQTQPAPVQSNSSVSNDDDLPF